MRRPRCAQLLPVLRGRAPQPVPGNRLLFGFDDVPPYYLNCLVTLGCKVRPGFRLVECHCVIQAVPFDDARTLGRRPTLYLNNPSKALEPDNSNCDTCEQCHRISFHD
jgi:hypothetical protein